MIGTAGMQWSGLKAASGGELRRGESICRGYVGYQQLSTFLISLDQQGLYCSSGHVHPKHEPNIHNIDRSSYKASGG